MKFRCEITLAILLVAAFARGAALQTKQLIVLPKERVEVIDNDTGFPASTLQPLETISISHVSFFSGPTTLQLEGVSERFRSEIIMIEFNTPEQAAQTKRELEGTQKVVLTFSRSDARDMGTEQITPHYFTPDLRHLEVRASKVKIRKLEGGAAFTLERPLIASAFTRLTEAQNDLFLKTEQLYGSARSSFPDWDALSSRAMRLIDALRSLEAAIDAASEAGELRRTELLSLQRLTRSSYDRAIGFFEAYRSQLAEASTLETDPFAGREPFPTSGKCGRALLTLVPPRGKGDQSHTGD